MVHVILKKTCHTCFKHIVLHLIFVALCGEEWCLNTVFTDIARMLKLRTCLVTQSICVLSMNNKFGNSQYFESLFKKKK